MITRLFLIFGIMLLGGTAWFIVGSPPPTVQATPEKALTLALQEKGVLPSGDIRENEAIEHSVFEIPETDKAMLDDAMKGMTAMPGMNMDHGTMDMSGDGAAKSEGDAGTMAMDHGTMDMSGDGAAKSESDAGTMAMDHSKMGHDDMKMGDGAGVEEELDEEAKAQAMAQQMAGLVIRKGGDFDRAVSLSMSEWRFSAPEIEVNQGERIKLTVQNDGNVPHEFMFMTMAAMQALDYRAKRADWSLLEHEALFEKSLLLPGQQMTFVAEVTKAGSWMFMCMLPYHMQLGMMGQFATPGMAMKM